jgi:hypothetical protein
MARLDEYLGKVDFCDDCFVGTVAFRNEEKTLPDGSKAALGIDDGHWVLVNQPVGAPIQVFEFDQKKKKIVLDKKIGGDQEVRLFKQLVGYFFANAHTEDLVTLLPPSS